MMDTLADFFGIAMFGGTLLSIVVAVYRYNIHRLRQDEQMLRLKLEEKEAARTHEVFKVDAMEKRLAGFQIVPCKRGDCNGGLGSSQTGCYGCGGTGFIVQRCTPETLGEGLT